MPWPMDSAHQFWNQVSNWWNSHNPPTPPTGSPSPVVNGHPVVLKPLSSIEVRDQVQTPAQVNGKAAGQLSFVGAKPYPKVDFQPPVRLGDGVEMYVPENPVRPNGSVDVIIQFRGVAPQRFKEGGVNAVVITAETEGLSGAMMKKFGQKSFVSQTLDKAMAKIRQQYGPEVKSGRLALGSFSAGYAPLQVALSDPAIRARTDAVMVIDGIHFGSAGHPNPAAHQPFVDFAREASQNHKLMVISHSAIKPNYSSSTDAANYIAAQVGAQRQNSPTDLPDWTYPTRYGNVVAPSSHADKGNFHIEGYDGHVARSHVEQIDNLGNLWNRYLAPRWEN